MSSKSVAMARAVLVEGLTYNEAARASGKTNRAFAHHVVKTLMHRWVQDGHVRVYESVKGKRAEKIGVWGARSHNYSNLPILTLVEFEALVAIAQSKKNPRKRISDRSVAMARGVLVEGATYTETGLRNGRPPSSVHQAVAVVLQYLHQIAPVSQRASFEERGTLQS